MKRRRAMLPPNPTPRNEVPRNEALPVQAANKKAPVNRRF
jgi:hypothetical protein